MKTLREFREAIGMTQEEMATNLLISKSFYEKIENGERKPGRELIERFKMKYPILDINIFLNLENTKWTVKKTKTQNATI